MSDGSGHDQPTEVVSVDPDQPDPAAIDRAARVIRAGGLVAFPTETVYGLGANALDAAAVARIFAAKDRPAHDPLIVHLADTGRLGEVTRDVPEIAYTLAAAFWPGPLTLVLPRSEIVPDNVTAGLATVAVRVPAHPVALALLRASGVPIAAPSANLFSRPSPTRAEHVVDDLAGRIGLVLDGGPTEVGVESTILDLTVDPPRLLRPGGVTVEKLARVLGFPPSVSPVAEPSGQSDAVGGGLLASPSDEGVPQKAPGMLMKHYSPRADLMLIVGGESAVRDEMRRRAVEARARGRRVGLLVSAEDETALADLASAPDIAVEVPGSQSDLEMVARNLFSCVRRLDRVGVDLILARDFGVAGLGRTIRDRLTRAAEGRIITAPPARP
jgi:L-threonylcarbamoyladenylate synthase